MAVTNNKENLRRPSAGVTLNRIHISRSFFSFHARYAEISACIIIVKNNLKSFSRLAYIF